MARVEIERILDAPIESVFEILSDHAAYSRFPGVKRSELIRSGDEEENGVGALRRIHSWGLRFDEEITHFERPTRLDYLIREVNVPLDHEGGSIQLEAVPSGTRVHWVSTFRFTTPVVGGLIGLAVAPVTARQFGSMLEETGRLAG